MLQYVNLSSFRLTLSAITPNPTHISYPEDGTSPPSAMELATKKRDRENKENKEKILSSNRREIERKNEYQVSGNIELVSIATISSFIVAVSSFHRYHL